MISPDDFRDVLRHFAAGVTVVTAGTGDDVHGMTVSAFSSVSAEPPLIAVILNQAQSIHRLLAEEAAPMAVSILGADQVETSNRFAFSKEDRFSVGQWTTAETGAPVLADALAWLDCRVHERHEAGSHVIYLAEVVASETVRPDESPLVYWNRDYRRLSSEGGA